jgi:acyl-CoA thioesterase-2
MPELKGDSISAVKGADGRELRVRPDEEAASTDEGVPATEGDPRTDLTELLRLERLGPELFRAAGRSSVYERSFGGAVLAQALLAAGRTVPDGRDVHSLHAYFLRPGDPEAPTDYAVEVVRDGATYATRRVTGRQGDRATVTLTASFQVPEAGFEHQVPALDAPAPDVLPGPEELVDGTTGLAREWLGRLAPRHPFDFRFDGELPRLAAARDEAAAPRQRFWVRCRDRLPDDALVHSCVAAYASDMLLLSTAVAPHRTMVGAPDLVTASLDHAVWFHRPVRLDDWLFVDQESSWAAGGRGLCSGRVFDRSGRLLLTVAQEGMVRPRAVT